MPRRYVDYLASDGFTDMNTISTIGSFLLGASTLPFLYNVMKSMRGPKVTTDDPWGYGRSLEWATSCPPPRHNFLELPRIRSESPGLRPALPARRRDGPADRGQEPARPGLGEPDLEGGTGGERDEGRGLAVRGRVLLLRDLGGRSTGMLAEEPVGTVALAFTAGLAFLVGYYLLFTARRIDPRPEDSK